MSSSAGLRITRSSSRINRRPGEPTTRGANRNLQSRRSPAERRDEPRARSKHMIDRKPPSPEEFKKKYSVDVDYEEKILDNPSFIETIKPALVGNLPTGWDLMVVTDWMASKVVKNGWAEKIDQSNVPNCVANLRDALKNQP